VSEESELDLVIEKVVSARAAGMTPQEMFGGPRDWIDQGVPPVAFVIGNAINGLTTGIWCAVAAEVLVILVRLVQRQTLRHAFSGAVGVGIAVLIARATGKAKNYFLPGIVINAVYAVAFLVSAVIGKPLVGVIMRYLDERPKAWHDHPRVKRAYTEATIGWAFVSIARVAVQESLRRLDLTGWLAVSKLAMGWPLYLAALALTKPYIAWRTQGLEVPAEPEAEAGGEDAGDDAADRVDETDAAGRGDDLDGVGGERRVGADEPDAQRRRGRVGQRKTGQ
jgi:hypothetical protein